MKSFLFLLFIGIQTTYGIPQEQNLSLSLKNVTLRTVLKTIEQQSDYRFLFVSEDVDAVKDLSISIDMADIDAVLNHCFEGTSLVFEKDGSLIVVKNAKSQGNKVFALSGTVVDEDGIPLPGVTVLLKGTNLGASTDVNGNFKLQLPVTKFTQFLVCSFVGMKSQEVKLLPGKTMYKIVMENEAQKLEDVVVTGYFQRKKVSQTGSEVVVDGEELKKVGSLNLIQAIASFDPSVRTIENNEFGSDPNRLPEITVRGEKGIDLRSEADDARTNPNAPLYIMDGIEVSPTTVYDMDMNRISSFSILKDAAATSLYGSRGANGVILITTIRPKEGEIKVTLNGDFNISVPDLRSYNLMDAREKLEYERLAKIYTDPYNNKENQTLLDIRYNAVLAEVARGVNTYWLSQPLRTSLNQRYSAYFEGGDKHFRYGINFKCDDDKGVMKGSGRRKYGINVYFSYDIDNKLIIRNDVRIDDIKATNSPYGQFSRYARMNPYERIYDSITGEINRIFDSNGQKIRNPLVDANLPNKDFRKYTQFSDNLQIQWWATKNLFVKGNAAITKKLDHSERYKSAKSSEFDHVQHSAEKGKYSVTNGTDLNFEGNLTLNYNDNFFDRLSVSLGLGTEILTLQSNTDGFTATGFLNDKLAYPAYAVQYLNGSSPKGSFDKSKAIGFLGNLNLNWDNRYIADVSYRTDGSSRFGRDSRFAPFWAVGLAWNVNRENFWTAPGYLKLRASVGSTGSTNFSADQAMTRFIFDSESEYNGFYGGVINAYGNPALKWQNVLKYNMGADMNILKNLITLNFDVYLERTENLLLNIDVAPSTGFTHYKENMGSLDNKGFDARLRFNVLNNRAKDIDWSLTFSVAHEKNKIRKLSNAVKAMNEEALKLEHSTSDSDVYRMYEVGRSQSALMVVPSMGIDPHTGNEVYIKRDGRLTFDYDPNDKINVGDTRPKLRGFFNSNFNWKNLNLYMNFGYEFGAKQFNSTLARKVEGADPLYNADSRVLYDRWKKPGDKAMFRRIDDTSVLYQSTRLVQKNNFLKLSSLSLSYELPVKLLKKTFIERCRFNFSMTDLFRISTIKQERGTSYPFARTLTMGFNMTF